VPESSGEMGVSIPVSPWRPGGTSSVTRVSDEQEDVMSVSTLAGVSLQAAVVGVLVGVAAVVVLARVLARRSNRTERTLVSLNEHE
jgi:membrane associated rhomboid family serine protease